MKYKYKTISLKTVKGFKDAERLHRNGWKIVAHGIASIQFEKSIKTRKK